MAKTKSEIPELLQAFCKEHKIHPLMLIACGVSEMNWVLAVPKGKKNDNVRGMVVGVNEYVDEVLSGKYATKKRESFKKR